MSFHECVLSEVDLFGPQYLQTSITKCEDGFYNSITSLDNCNVIEFIIPSSSDHYKDLNTINLHLKVQLLKNTGEAYKENLTDASKKIDELATQPCLINYPLHTIFKTITVYMNNKVVSSCENYNFKSYLDLILNSDDSSLSTSKFNEGFTKDSVGTDMETYLDKNKGMKERRALTINSTVFDMVGTLNVDIFKINKLLLPNVDLKIVLTLENPNFFIKEKSDQLSIFRIHEAMLQVKSFTLNPNVSMNHAQMLMKNIPAVYPYRRTEIKTFTLASGIRSSTIDNIFTGKLPSNITITLVNNGSFSGMREKNPFYFFHQNLSSIGLYVNSACATQTPLEMNYSSNGFARAYNQFLEGCNKLHSGYSNSITKNDFRRNYCIYPFLLSPTQRLDEGNCTDLTRDGNVRLELKFATPPSDTLTVLVYGEFEAQLRFDKNLNPTII